MDREKLLGLARPDVVQVGPVPGWDEKVYLRPLGVRARAEYAKPFLEAAQKKEPVDIEAHLRTRMQLVLWSICDKDGTRLLRDDDFSFIEEMDQKPFEFLIEEVEKLNGFGVKAEGEVVKN